MSEEEMANRIVEVYTDEYKKLQVHCKNFDVRCFFLDGRDEGFENGIDIFLGEFLKNEDNKVKIVAPLAPIPNIYSLCVLTTLSRLLSELKSREQDNFKDILKQLEFDILLMQIVRIDYLVDPFIRHTKQIMDFTNKLKLGINIVLPFTQSFLNTMIKNIKILDAKMASECLKNIKYLKIDNKDINKLPDDWRTKLDEIKEGTSLHERAKKVLFKGGMVHDLLGVLKGKYIEEIQKNDLKIILIIPEPTKMIINEMKDLISTNTNNNIMILYYTDPVHQNDPPKILRNIASYVTILSPYYHILELEPYGMDEYYNIAMLTQFENRMFDIPSELENLISAPTALKFHQYDKNADIDRLKKTLAVGDMEEMHKTFEKIEKDYIEKAKKISKIENDSILSVQDTALDQLKLIL